MWKQIISLFLARLKWTTTTHGFRFSATIQTWTGDPRSCLIHTSETGRDCYPSWIEWNTKLDVCKNAPTSLLYIYFSSFCQFSLTNFNHILKPIFNHIYLIFHPFAVTMTGKALRHARDVVFRPGNGQRNGVRKVIIVVTDGDTDATSPVDQISQELRDSGTLVSLKK